VPARRPGDPHRRSLAAALTERISPLPPLRAVRDGVIVGATNPKTIVIFAVALPALTSRAPGQLPVQQQMLILGVLFPLMALVLDGVWAAAPGTAQQWFVRSPRRLAVIGGTGGLAMIGLAATGRKD
jgi:threonine/homoserine/homoserine lactone efflux protein